MADTMKLEVYNLAPEQLKMLLDTKNRSIQMSVGYEDELSNMSMLMDGYVVNVYGRKSIPEHITSIWCVPYSAETLSSNSNLNTLVYEGGTLRGLINEISKYAGYKSPPKFFGMADDVLTSPILSYILRGTVSHSLSELGDEYGFYVRASNSGVQIVSRLNSANVVEMIKAGEAAFHKMSIDKLKGTPEATVAKLNFVMNLDASIDCGDVVDVTAFLGARTNDPNRPQADGVVSVDNADSVLFRSDSLWAQTIFEQYLVLGIQHVGSNYAPAWETRIVGIQFNDGLAGDKDVSGNGRGTGTWDIDVGAEVRRTKGVPRLDQTVGITAKEATQLEAVKFTDEQNKAIADASGGDEAKAKFLRNKLIIENRGNSSVRNATSSAGAAGPYQLMPETARNLGLTVEKGHDDRNDFAKSSYAAGKLYDQLNERYEGNTDAMNANYNGGNYAADEVMNGRQAPAQETRDYLRFAHALDEKGRES
ncbi:transglycosylase SLT domain-containing protein [Pseudomonas brenneri]|uniref:transglycosylase SLT domain-containing protein n=1 Tax=Pseudomonas brenneri TaxID=129817 RepID=UPI0025A2CA85|nr:transglycosylase SLT domain-containing protein [Pseudomonas brenneri]WJM94077.1 transglycosylase SLT domain-containing protein [Pseudomonas brenneri]